MMPIRKANGEHVEDITAATQMEHKHELPAVDSIIGDMSRKPPTREFEMLEVLLRLVDGQEKDRALLIQMAAKQNGNANGNGKKWWVSPVLAGAIAVAGMGGFQFVSKSQSTNEKELNIITYRLDQAEFAAKEKAKEVRLLEEYNRDLYIWFSDHGIKGVPSPPKLKEDN